MAEETCCYRLRITDGVSSNASSASAAAKTASETKLAKVIKWLDRFPAKVGIGVILVEITRVETNESHTFAFVGIGLGFGFSLTTETKGEGRTICCSLKDCPTFESFEGWGRMTMASVGAVYGGIMAYFDFGSSGGCPLYFENVAMLIKGAGFDAGIYFGYYVKLD